jgi:hypothetical protein
METKLSKTHTHNLSACLPACSLSENQIKWIKIRKKSMDSHSSTYPVKPHIDEKKQETR